MTANCRELWPFQSTFERSQNMPSALIIPFAEGLPLAAPLCSAISESSALGIGGTPFARSANRPFSGRMKGDAAPSLFIEAYMWAPTVAQGVAPKTVFNLRSTISCTISCAVIGSIAS